LGLYLHIPFCTSKCPYCDFYSITDVRVLDRYLRALEKQMSAYEVQTRSYLVDTVYVGGGTPSLIDRRQWKRLFRTLRKHFRIAPGAEITVEVNPDSTVKKVLSTLRKLGVNRISIGAQSFNNDLLGAIGRRHTAEQTMKAFEAARAARIENVNLDLMFGLPGQTLEQLCLDLDTATALGASHLSVYGLKIEEDTPFWEVRDTLDLPDEKSWVEQYLEMTRRMRNGGYVQYEISNFCKPGCESKHNMKYWTLAEYLGLGAGASSYLGNRRFSFIKDVRSYCSAIETDEGQIVSEVFEVAPQDALADTVMLALRLSRGIHIDTFQRTFRRDFVALFGSKLEKYIHAGLVVVEDGYCRLTSRGFCVSNHIIADLIDL